MNEKAFEVIDNFYRDPSQVRRLARECEYAPRGTYSQNFAGIESVHNFFSETVVKKIEGVVGRKIVVDTARNAFGRFRLALAADTRRTQVHTDNTHFTAVIYLTEAQHCKGGTMFFKHRETGFSRVPTDGELSMRGMDRRRFNREVVMKDSLDLEKWEVIDQCDMRFNRCVILRGRDFFHGSDQLFGSDFSDARLTQNFFFNLEGSV